MVYTILISIVFIAEIIIAVTVIQNLLRLDKVLIELNETVEVANPKIRELSCLVKKISEQSVELSEDFAIRFKEKRNGNRVISLAENWHFDKSASIAFVWSNAYMG